MLFTYLITDKQEKEVKYLACKENVALHGKILEWSSKFGSN